MAVRMWWRAQEAGKQGRTYPGRELTTQSKNSQKENIGSIYILKHVQSHLVETGRGGRDGKEGKKERKSIRDQPTTLQLAKMKKWPYHV